MSAVFQLAFTQKRKIMKREAWKIMMATFVKLGKFLTLNEVDSNLP